MTIIKIKLTASVLAVLLLISSCKKDYLDTEPSNAIEEEEAYSTTDLITSTLDGAYRTMFAYALNGTEGHDQFGQKAIDIASDLMGNDMVVHSQGYGWFNRDYQYTEWIQPTPTTRRSDIAWFYYYNLINQANLVINNVDAAKNPDGSVGPSETKDILKGQGLGMRAYCLFYLVNLFQQTYKGNESKPGVPIYLEFATSGNARGTVEEVYDQIVLDLTAAETLLNGKPRTSKVNIDVSVIRGLRAKTALIQEDWATAASKANAARQGYTLMTSTQYGNVSAFSVITGSEWMWGSLIPNDQATIYASFFSHMDVRTGGYAALGGQKKITKALYDQINASDARKSRWKAPGTGSDPNVDYNQLKFQVPTVGSWAGDYLYMRASEMYLIEAEALARQGQDAAARTALETLIKARYAAYSAASFSGAALINEIILQRRIELWGEGFSLIDIKRLHTGLNRPTGAGNHGSPNLDPIVYTAPDAEPRFLMKIPQREIDNNENMTAADQNP